MPSSYTIGEHYEAFVKQLVESGRYMSASEVMRESLRLLEDQEQLREIKLKALREEIQKGLKGPFEPLDMEAIIAKAKSQRATRDAA